MSTCKFAVLDFCSCGHRTCIPVQCDRKECRSICEDMPERLDALCHARYVWSYERCTIDRFHRGERARAAATWKRVDELLKNHEHSELRDEMETEILSRDQRFEDRRNEFETGCAEEIRQAVRWVSFYGSLVKGVQHPVTEHGKNLAARILGFGNKPRDLIVMRNKVHTLPELMVLQKPPRVYLPLFMKRERDQARKQRRDRVPMFGSMTDEEKAVWAGAERDAELPNPPVKVEHDKPVPDENGELACMREVVLPSTEVSTRAQSSESPEESSPWSKADSKSEEESPELQAARHGTHTKTRSPTFLSSENQSDGASTEPSTLPSVSPESAALKFLSFLDQVANENSQTELPVPGSPRPQALNDRDVSPIELDSPPPVQPTPIRSSPDPSRNADR